MIVADLISSSPSDTPAVLSLFGIFVAGTFATAALMIRTAARRDKRAAQASEADRSERIKLSDAISLMAKNSGKEAEATRLGFAKLTKSSERTADEAKLRNGHLGDQNMRLATLIQSQSKDIHSISKTLDSSVITLAKETKAAALHVAEVKNDLAKNT